MKPHTAIGWDTPGTTISGRARVRSYYIGRARPYAIEGVMENDVRVMTFTLPLDLYEKLSRAGKDALVAIKYLGREGNAKMFCVLPVDVADDSGAAAYAAEVERAVAEQKAKYEARQEAERQTIIAKLAPAYGAELAEKLARTIDGVVLRWDGDVEYRLVHRSYGFGPRDKNVDNVVGLISGKTRPGSTHFVTPAELLAEVGAAC
jgi:hypothetical protein